MPAVYFGKNDAQKQFTTGFFRPKRRISPGFLIIHKAGFYVHFNKTGDFIASDIAIEAFFIGVHN